MADETKSLGMDSLPISDDPAGVPICPREDCLLYVKKPIPVAAKQWFKNGDHPQDACEMLTASGNVEGMPKGERFLSEGKVVRYFRHPAKDDKDICHQCKNTYRDHGWIDTLEGGHIVCPGDFVITGVFGEHYPCKPNIFAQTYQAATPKPTSTPHTPDICKGFMVEVRIHTDDGRQVLENPEIVRNFVGAEFDMHGLSEEVDYTLEVRRIYEQS